MKPLELERLASYYFAPDHAGMSKLLFDSQKKLIKKIPTAKIIEGTCYSKEIRYSGHTGWLHRCKKTSK